MVTAISTKLMARIVASVDMDLLFPAPALKGLVALDVYVDKGEICTGKRVFLTSRFDREEVTIKGIEMKADLADPNKVRIVCTKPKRVQIPLSDNDGCGWTICEE